MTAAHVGGVAHECANRKAHDEPLLVWLIDDTAPEGAIAFELYFFKLDYSGCVLQLSARPLYLLQGHTAP